MTEKRFEATIKKLEKAKKSGKNGKSSLFTQCVVLTILLISTCYIFEPIFLVLKKVLEYSLTDSQKDLFLCFTKVPIFFIKFIGSCLMFAAVLATFIEGIQVGFRIKPNLIAPSVSKISPVSNLKNLPLNLKKIFINSSLIILLLSSIVFILNRNISSIGSLITLSSFDKFQFIKSNLLMLFWITLLTFWIVALIDIIISQRKFRKDTMMSLDELKEELKENEGNPEMKSARAQAHQALLYEEIVKRVRHSKVIVVAKESGVKL